MGAAETDRAEREFVRFLLRHRDQVRQRVRGGIRAHGNDEGVVDQRRNHLKTVGRVVRQLLVERARDRVRAGHESQRVAVGRRVGDGRGGDVAAGARLGLHDDRLSQPLRKAVGNNAGERVGSAAGRKSVQQADRAVRIGLRLRLRWREREQGRDCKQG